MFTVLGTGPERSRVDGALIVYRDKHPAIRSRTSASVAAVMDANVVADLMRLGARYSLVGGW